VSFDVNSDYRIVFQEKQAVTKKGELVAPLRASSETWRLRNGGGEVEWPDLSTSVHSLYQEHDIRAGFQFGCDVS